MRAVPRRVATNLGWVVVISSVLVVGGIIRFMGGAFFGSSYTVAVDLPEAGGALPGQPVTVLGTTVGTIQQTDLTENGVHAVLEIDGKEDAPASALVQVLRRSPIGEQAIELTPVAPDWSPPKDRQLVPSRVTVADHWKPAAHGSTIDARAVVTPSSVPALLDRAKVLLEHVDGEDLNTIVTELANAVDGRVETMRNLNRDAAELGTTLANGIPDFDRLIRSSEPLLATLRDQRETLAAAIRSSADVSETLANARPASEQLLSDAPALLQRADGLIRAQRPNLHCLDTDLLALNRMTVEPSNLDDLKMILDLNRYFYGGFDAGTQWDPYRPGVIWARVNILLTQEAGGQPYAPHRATPATKPGAACQSPFGFGVQAVRQTDPPPVPPDPTSPGIEYAPLAEGAGSSGSRTATGAAAPAATTPATTSLAFAPTASDRGPATPPATPTFAPVQTARDRTPPPDTGPASPPEQNGGGGIVALLGVLALGTGAVTRRRLR